MRSIFFLCCCMCSISLSAQQINTIKGFVKDEKNNAIAKATVTLIIYPDTKSVKTTTTDSLGAYVFTNIEESKYIVLVRATGFKIDQSAPFIFLEKDVEVPDVIMDINEKKIKKVRH